jgi:hypothetical protein
MLFSMRGSVFGCHSLPGKSPICFNALSQRAKRAFVVFQHPEALGEQKISRCASDQLPTTWTFAQSAVPLPSRRCP